MWQTDSEAQQIFAKQQLWSLVSLINIFMQQHRDFISIFISKTAILQQYLQWKIVELKRLEITSYLLLFLFCCHDQHFVCVQITLFWSTSYSNSWELPSTCCHCSSHHEHCQQPHNSLQKNIISFKIAVHSAHFRQSSVKLKALIHADTKIAHPYSELDEKLEVSNLHKRFFRFLLASDKSFEKRGTKDYCTCCANSLSFCKTLGGPVSYQSGQNSIIMIHFPSDWWLVCGWQRAKSFSSLKDD